MMRTILLLLLTVCLLSIGTAIAQNNVDGSEPTYRVERIASSVGYHLSGINWQFSGVSSSSRYQLLSQLDQQTYASGCCCVYLPCVRRFP